MPMHQIFVCLCTEGQSQSEHPPFETDSYLEGEIVENYADEWQPSFTILLPLSTSQYKKI